MKTLNTLLGTATITDARMIKASGYNSYEIVVNFTLDGEAHEATLKTNDSELWDDYTDREIDSFDYLKEHAEWSIEEAVTNYIDKM